MTRTISIKNYLRIGLFVGLFVFIALYAFSKTRALDRGVSLDINGIENGSSLTGAHLTLWGNALHASHLLINGREIAIDKENNFSENITLSPGYNIITIEAEDRFGKNTKEIYEVVYLDSEEKVVFQEGQEDYKSNQ